MPAATALRQSRSSHVVSSVVMRRLTAAIGTRPRVYELAGAALASVAFGVAAYSFAAATGLRDDMLHGAPSSIQLGVKLPLTALRTFIVPGLMEELLWRAALLPHPSFESNRRRGFALQLLASNVAYMSSHLLIGQVLSYAGLRPGAARLFGDVRFLVCTAGLGAVCTLVYYACRGSIWTPTLVHALVVTVWLLFFGGDHLLRVGTE